LERVKFERFREMLGVVKSPTWLRPSSEWVLAWWILVFQHWWRPAHVGVSGQ
jgi:hypothetical protein